MKFFFQIALFKDLNIVGMSGKKHIYQMCPKFIFHPNVRSLSLPSQRHSESFVGDAVSLKGYLISSFGSTELKPGIYLWNTRDLFSNKGILSIRQRSREEFTSGEMGHPDSIKHVFPH